MKRRSYAYGPVLGDGKGHYYCVGDKAWSYNTCIWQRAGWLTIGNVTRYSETTSRHQERVGSYTADVILDNVPEGTSDLLALAVQRGLIVYPAPPVPAHLLPGSVLE